MFRVTAGRRTGQFETKLYKILKSSPWNEALKAATPSLQLRVYTSGKLCADIQWGKEYTYYDWASLTKVAFTVSVFMHLVNTCKLNLDDHVVKWLPWLPFPKIRLRNVLSHNAGFENWLPAYRFLNLNLDTSLRLEQLKLLLRDLRQNKSKQAVYSDIDFWILRFVLESEFQQPLLTIFDQYKELLHLGSAHFCIKNKPLFNRTAYAPTEKCPWRKRVLQGEVHDENAWSMGGVSTHAGLFGRMEDLSAWILSLRQQSWCSQGTQAQFFKRQMPSSRGDWAVGWMLPSAGRSSSGVYFSPESVGHTGFVGNSLWWDRKKDILILILSNRVHPTRKNQNFVKLRPRLHDLVREQLNL